MRSAGHQGSIRSGLSIQNGTHPCVGRRGCRALSRSAETRAGPSAWCTHESHGHALVPRGHTQGTRTGKGPENVPLDEVATLLDDPDADPRAHLRRQHELLSARIVKLQQMVTAVETAMEAQRMGINLTPEEKFEVFGDFDPDQHAEEVERRWGDTEAYAESQRRTAWGYKDQGTRGPEVRTCPGTCPCHLALVTWGGDRCHHIARPPPKPAALPHTHRSPEP